MPRHYQPNILYTALQWLSVFILTKKNNPYSTFTSYGVSFIRIWEKIDSIITAPHCSDWGWVGLWGFLWWAPSAKRKDHHRVSSGWSNVWHQYWPIWYTIWADPNYTWGLAILADSLLFSVNNILAGLWLNCISSAEITLFLLADILLQHKALL